MGKGCAKFLLYGFGVLIFLSIVSSVCRGCAGPAQPETVRQSAAVERLSARATAKPTLRPTFTAAPTPTPAPTPMPAVKLPLLVKARSGWQFQISEVRTLEAVETDSERMRPKNGVFVVLIGEVRNFTDKDGCIHGRDFQLRAGDWETPLEERLIGPVREMLGGMDYPGSFLGQCLDYDASAPSFLVFDAPADKLMSLVIDESAVPIGLIGQLAEASARPTATPFPTEKPAAAVAAGATRPPTAASTATPAQPALSATPAPVAVALRAAPALALPPAGQPVTDAPITVGGWNVGLDDADVATVAARLAAFEGVQLWGLAEVNRADALDDLEAAAEAGEAGDFGAVLGSSGGGMRLAALYDDSRFDLLEWYELEEINTTGNARAPLVLHLADTLGGEQFLFMVNHLYRSRDDERHAQAQLLNEWAEGKALPVLAVGDYNFDWEVQGGDGAHDAGYDLMTEGGAWEWVRPPALVTTQCSGWPCRYNSVLDFVFTAGPARAWAAESEIAVAPDDFPDTIETSDHRPVLATFWPQTEAPAEPAVVVPPAAPTVVLPAATVPPPTATAMEPATAVPPPTATAVPPTATPLPAGPLANSGANLRGGPGTDFPIVGGAAAGQTLEIVGRNDAGDWYRLADGSWIAAFLVDGAPANLGAVEAPPLPTPPPAPPVEERAASAPVPVQEAPPTAAPPPPVVEPPPSDCDPSYPTLCIPRGIGDLDCGDIGARRFPVPGSDPHRFDGDNDGVGCESG